MNNTTNTLHALVSSDWHLGGMNKLLGGNNINAVELQLKEIEKVYKYAVMNGIEHLFVPGDLFDIPVVSYDDVLMLTLLLLRYKDTVKTYYIAGNHDFSEKGRTSLNILKAFADYGLIPNLYVYLEPEVVEIDGMLVGFVPYPCLDARSIGENSNSKKGKLNFCHVDYPGAIGDNGHELKLDKEATKYQQNKLDYTISGHIHLHQVLKRSAFMYTGSLYQKTFAEQLPKGFLEIQVNYDENNRVLLRKKFIRSVAKWQLSDIHIEDNIDIEKTMVKIQRTPNVKYRVIIDEDVKLPSDFMAQCSNVIKLVGKNSKDKSLKNAYGDLLSELTAESSNKASKSIKIDIAFGLDDYLKSRGHSEDDISLANSMVQQALSEITAEEVG